MKSTNAGWSGETLTFEKLSEMVQTMNDFRKRTEIKIGGVAVNVADYEEVTKNNSCFLPAGYRAFLNVRRTVYNKTFDPMPTDLLIFNMANKTCYFAGGDQKRWKDFWQEFVDEKRITTKAQLFLIAAARSPDDGNKITDDSRQYLEAEIFAHSQGKLKFSELKAMEHWRIANLWIEMFVDKKTNRKFINYGKFKF